LAPGLPDFHIRVNERFYEVESFIAGVVGRVPVVGQSRELYQILEKEQLSLRTFLPKKYYKKRVIVQN
jgi:hypothetical protein